VFFQGKVDAGEMSRTFNCGIGFVVITSSEHQSAVLQRLHADGEVDARVIGSVVPLGIINFCVMFLFSCFLCEYLLDFLPTITRFVSLRQHQLYQFLNRFGTSRTGCKEVP